MQENEKHAQLRKHKALATGLFVFMTLVFIASTWLLKTGADDWLGYVKAFSEAAMVGALADWFAVTALFHHPLGIPIPHTNLIENSKARIGDNLGNFVVYNFLTAENLRPYINKISIAPMAAEWLAKDKSKALLLREVSNIISRILIRLDEKEVTQFIARKGEALLQDLKLHKLAAGAIEYVMEQKEHEKLITLLAGKIKEFIAENGELVKQRVHKESYFFIPGFVDRKLADRITQGLIGYFEEIEKDTSHRVREEILLQIHEFVERLHSDPALQNRLSQLKDSYLTPDKLESYAQSLWVNLRDSLLTELKNENSTLQEYLNKNLAEFSEHLQEDKNLQNKIDSFIKVTGYRYILKNAKEAGTLISDTVGNWKGRELSQKLELEVGKDLQFIRINGTLVGGMVGLLLYVVSKWIG